MPVAKATTSADGAEMLPADVMRCAYCGLDDAQYLTFCEAENCQKWFCNGSSDFSKKAYKPYSHIVAHCTKAKHTAVSVFSGIPEGTSKRKRQSMKFIFDHCTYKPKCSSTKCRSRNILDLGVEDTAHPFDPEKICCRKDAVRAHKVGRKLWHTLVAAHPETGVTQSVEEPFFIRLASWLVPAVPKKIMRKHSKGALKKWGLERLDRDSIGFLEEFWRWKPDGTKEEFLNWKMTIDSYYETRRMQFTDEGDYSKYWDELVAEIARQEMGTVESLPPIRIPEGQEAKWLNGSDIILTVPYGMFTDFLERGRPVMVAWVVMSNGEEKTMWYRDATISWMKPGDNGSTMMLHCFKEVARDDYREKRNLQIRIVYNDINFWRMHQALYKIEHDPKCMSREILYALLGCKMEAQELPEESASEAGESMSCEMLGSSDESHDEEIQVENFQPVVKRFPRTMIRSNLRLMAPQPFFAEYTVNGYQHDFRRFTFQNMRLPECLNKGQRQAVRMALLNTVCLIQGPPGTGKTQTAAVIVANLVKDPEGKILVCAPSNVAIDHLTLKLIEASKDFKILRLLPHGRDIESDAMPDVVKQYTVNARFAKERSGHEATDEEMRAFEKQCVQEAQIICCTCNSAGLASLRGIPFPYVLIDEAAQAMEPECLIPITKACEKLILIGDPSQLGAVVRFPNMQRSQLTMSLFQRLWEQCPSIMLTTQYRMHPNISEMVSQITYDNKLVNDQSVYNRPPPTSFSEQLFESAPPPSQSGACKKKSVPILFVDAGYNDEISASGTSFVNMIESHFIARLVANILHNGDVFSDPAKKPKPEDIGIITFYNGQRPQLEIDLKVHPRVTASCLGSGKIEINSVDGFQGREKEIIILSCVRSADTFCGRSTLGFTDDRQRLNVAMSRAKTALFVVGSRRIFQHSAVWRQYFEYIPQKSLEAVCHALPEPCSTKPQPCKVCRSRRPVVVEAVEQ
ncbi:regulator of nonsense transcripts 1-like [Paramacrobiotus metropolitanus]|uniref:regulator of nonsense transcripts 1-like n=1 Tax=Paramacrobiotus metropolitanus TaxID=2943436 RepID=UPI002445D4AB|nr:regulator of nonsense transcripts 1-like [Paramacrobiotus metropolitanus]